MIFVIIPVFNRRELTRACLSSLRKQTFAQYKIIVVDDGSTDGTSEMIQENFPDVVLLKGDGNLWWTGATNKGIEYVLQNRKNGEEDFVLTLNNDLEVPENYLERLYYHASVYKNALLGSISLDIKDPAYMDFCGIKWNEFTGKYHSKAKDFNHSYKDLKSRVNFVESDMLPGRGTLIPMKVFAEIGLFDSVNFPQYAGDEDFALRARRKGWRLLLPVDVYLKSHIGQTAVDTSRVELSLRHFKQMFFSIRSPLNLQTRYRFALKNTKSKIFYFLIELLRISFSLSKGVVAQKLKNLKSAK